MITHFRFVLFFFYFYSSLYFHLLVGSNFKLTNLRLNEVLAVCVNANQKFETFAKTWRFQSKTSKPQGMDLKIYRKSLGQPMDFILCDFHLMVKAPGDQNTLGCSRPRRVFIKRLKLWTQGASSSNKCLKGHSLQSNISVNLYH